MTDVASPNLRSRDFDVTSEFYEALGFEQTWRDDSWMILKRGQLLLEFFPFADLDPATSAFGSCLRLDDIDAFIGICRAAGVPEREVGWPRLHGARPQPWGGIAGALVDPDCNLLRIIQN